MPLQTVQRPANRHIPQQTTTPECWKKDVSEMLRNLCIIPDKFNGKVVISFKDGGVSYLEKSETFK